MPSRADVRVALVLILAILPSSLGASCRGASAQQTAEASPAAQQAANEAPAARAPATAATPRASPPQPPQPLESLFRKLTALQAGSRREAISIVHVGDSHVASDMMTAEVRRQLQQVFGDGGRGYAYPGRPWRSFRQENLRYDMGGEWERTTGRRADTPGPFGFGGVRLTSREPGAWIERSASGGDRFGEVVVTYLAQPEGGRLRVLVDDEEHAVLETQAEEQVLGVAQLAVGAEAGASLLRLEVVDEAPVTVMGIATGRGGGGVRYHAVGLNGAEAQTFLRFDEAMTGAELRALSPDLLVLGFGTNEAYNLRAERLLPEHYQGQRDRLVELVARYRRAVPGADCLILLPMDLALKPSAETCYERTRVRRRGRWRRVRRLKEGIDLLEHPECAWTTPQSLELIRKAGEAAARQASCAVWDQQLAMGGAGSIRTWAVLEPPLAAGDGVHLRMMGYRFLGQRLVVDLLEAYQRWQVTGRAELKTTYEPPLLDEEEVAASLRPGD